MQSITFALPSLGTSQMARQDQIDILVDQATAAIVCSYLEHMNAVMVQRDAPNLNTVDWFVNTTELVNLINSVQGALRAVP